MADDIDIEEHDILDNPRIQDILHIKEEPIELDNDLYEEPTATYDENNQYDEYYPEEKYEDQGHTDEPTPQYDQETPFDHVEHEVPEPRDLVFEDQGMEFESEADFNESGLESTTETEYVPDLSNEIYHHNNKIILGTKPCKRPTRDVNAAYVSLEDWGVRLQNSHCYCKECQTLFATQNALDAHNMIAHSFLVALDSPKTSEPETPAVPEKTETAKYCDHCKKYFPSDHALIQHLYDLITANKQTPAVQPVKYKDCTNTGQHMVYSCLICNSAYLDIKWFKVHMRTVHNKSEIGNYEYMPFNGVCRICNHTSTNLKRFNGHVKAMHFDRMNQNSPELLSESVESSSVKESQSKNVVSETENVESQQDNEESESEDEESQTESTEPAVAGSSVKTKRNKKSNFMCTKCKTFYTSIHSINHHRRKYHNGEKNIVKRLVPKSAVSKVIKTSQVSGTVSQKVPEIKSQDVPKNMKFVDNLVPKNSIFKCNRCVIHFVTCWSAILHSCADMISRYQCDVCCNQFRLKDCKVHDQQHKHNDAFNTYYISKHMNTKMLFWCQKCAVYFELRKIQNHMKTCNGTSSSVRCKLCEIDVSDILTHMQNHKLHSTKNDFIYIDDLLPDLDEEISPEKDLKRKLPMDSEPGPSKIKKLDSNQFMYCDLCHTCMRNSIRGRGCHATGECKKIKTKRNCEFCGLIFFTGVPMIAHEEFHRNSNVNLKDFTFVNLADQSPTVPLIPEFPKCERCDVHDFVGHTCGTFKACKICNKKFSEATYKLHLLHHKYLKDHKYLKEDTEVTALIKKYETLASTWNILYLCKTCNVATDSYDDVVFHCQNHYNSIQDYATRNCEICSLKLEENCYKRHNELHSPSITRDSFKTVVYDYKNLLNEDWLKLFGTLSQAEVHQIVTRSIYVTRFVKMKLILDGPPELTIYKCETCKLYVDPNAIYNHTTLCITAPDFHKKSFSCETCLIPFSTATARRDHEKFHTTPNVTANSFRIVAFNAKSDREFNSNLKVDADALEFQPKMPINVLPLNVKTNISKTALKNVIFYQCRQCRCCSSNAESLIRHKCLMGCLVDCKKCQLRISPTDEKEHRKWHKQNANITKAHIKLVIIDNNQLIRRKHVGEKPIYKLHQCRKCKVCYSFWVKHETCSKNYRQCKKCGYLFSYKSFENHNTWHQQNMSATRNDIKVVPLAQEESPKNIYERRKFLKSLKPNKDQKLGVSQPKVDRNTTLYQCYKCKICSYTVSFVKKHTVCASNKKGIYSCKICDLKFKYFGIKYHKAWHRDHSNLSRRHIKILPFKGMKILKIKDVQVSKIIENKTSIAKEKETSSNIVSNNDGYKCNTCGASSKKTIFLNKHKCSTSPVKTKVSPFVYYQCEDCGACAASKRHYCAPAHRIRFCPKCKLKFSSSSIYDHMQKHAQHKNMTRSKITVIPFRKNLDEDRPVDEPKPVKSAKPVQSSMKPVQSPTKTVQKVSTVYRCSCGLHFISQKTIERHFTICSPDNDIPSESCSKCGLLFPTNHLVSHLCNHHSYGKGNIEVKTIPTITYYRCGTCKCLFVNESRVLKHNKRCDPNNCRRVRCDECDLDFDESEIKMHSEIHKTTSDLYRPCRIVTINKDTQKLDSNKLTNDISEAGEANTSTQDVHLSEDDTEVSFSQYGVKYDKHLYKCKDCDTHYLKFDSYLRHVARKKCNDEDKPACRHCGLHFTQVSGTRHTYIHHEKMKLNVEDFVIIICDPKTGETYTAPASVQDKTPKIPQKSDNDSVDKKVDLFKCCVCNSHFLKMISLRNHIYNKRHSSIKHNCPECGLEFPKNILDTHLTLHHKKLGLNLENFNIVERAKLEDIPTEVAQKFKDVSEEDSGDRTVENEENSLTKDELDEPTETTVTEDEVEDIIYYHCVTCNLHFTNGRSLEYHFEGKHIRNSIETCELCGLSFNSMVRHKQHHESRSSGVFLIQDVNDESDSVNKLFKCQECGVHFMKSHTLIIHLNKLGQTHGLNTNRIENCPDCGLLFAQRTLKIHQALHHEKHSLRLEDLVVDTSIGKYRTFKFGSDDNNMVSQSSSEDVTEADKSIERSEDATPEANEQIRSASKSPGSSTKLYKCGKCNVYFLTQATCYKHIVKHIPMDPKEYIECKLCSFQFRIVSLNTHIRKHHKTDFAFEKVLIEEYQPKLEEERAPKIDIYYAKDKVQSRLITTTTEDNEVNSAEISQSEIDSADDPEASNHSRETVILDTADLDAESEVGENKNVMVKIPSFTDIKEENDSLGEVDSKPKINDGAQKSNEGASNVNELPLNDSESSEKYACGFCSESFVSRRAKDFHESLDHLDALKDCPICKKSFNTSVLNELHLQIKNEMFTCCVCSHSAYVDMLPHHSYIHKHIL